MNYRKEIDGLRAIAILPVIWSHSGLPYVNGGFLGVDVFFVISGYLITSILLNDFKSGRFSLVKFYDRRARRILPALCAVLIVTTICIPFVSSHPQYISDYGSSLFSTSVFISNIYFWQTSGYFGSVSELSPLLHTWSLAVEEQFYIFFPLLMILVLPKGKKNLIVSICLIGLISVLISEWGSINSPIANFYLLPTRAWELMIGSIVAIYLSSDIIGPLRKRYSNIISTFAFCVLLLSYFWFSPSTKHPSLITLIPVMSTALIIIFSSCDNLVGRALSSRFITFIGLISYSLYLWHQPILALMKKYYSIHLELHQIIISLLLIFSLSVLTWKYVETPFRDKNIFSRHRIFKYTGISIVMMSVIGFIYVGNLKLQQILVPDQMARYQVLVEAADSHSQQEMFESDCKFWSDELDEAFIERFDACANKFGKALFILGGSHGMDLYNAIAINTKYKFVVSVSRGFCRAHKFIGDSKNLPKCQYDDFLDFSSRFSNSILMVLYTQTPDRLFEGRNFVKATPDNLSKERMTEVVNYLSSLKKKFGLDVMMIGMLPPLAQSPINWNYNISIESQANKIISENAIYLTKHTDFIFSEMLSREGIRYVSKFDSFKLSFPSDLLSEGKITYSDSRHISEAGEKLFGRRLVSYLNEMGYREF